MPFFAHFRRKSSRGEHKVSRDERKKPGDQHRKSRDDDEKGQNLLVRPGTPPLSTSLPPVRKTGKIEKTTGYTEYFDGDNDYVLRTVAEIDDSSTSQTRINPQPQPQAQTHTVTQAAGDHHHLHPDSSTSQNQSDPQPQSQAQTQTDPQAAGDHYQPIHPDSPQAEEGNPQTNPQPHQNNFQKTHILSPHTPSSHLLNPHRQDIPIHPRPDFQAETSQAEVQNDSQSQPQTNTVQAKLDHNIRTDAQAKAEWEADQINAQQRQMKYRETYLQIPRESSRLRDHPRPESSGSGRR